MLVYEATMRAIRSITLLCDIDGPLTLDFRIDGFRHQLNNTALDLRLNDEHVRQAIEARAAFRAQELSIEDQQHAVLLASGLAEVSTDRLGARLVGDAETMSDADANSADKSAASYQYGSTVVGMAKEDREAVTTVAEASSIAGFFWSVVSWFH